MVRHIQVNAGIGLGDVLQGKHTERDTGRRELPQFKPCGVARKVHWMKVVESLPTALLGMLVHINGGAERETRFW